MKVFKSLIQFMKWRDEYDRAIATASKEDAVGIHTEFKRIFDLSSPLIAAGFAVCPGVTFTYEIGAPGEQDRIEFEPLGPKFSYGVLEMTA